MIKILAAIGNSRHAERALRLSCRLASNKLANITALTVDNPDEAKSLEQIRIMTLSVAHETGTVMTIQHASGQPDKVIREESLQGYDLLVIGARGLRSIQDFFLGRNAISLVKNLPVSTLVVRRQDTIRRILWRIPQGQIDDKQTELMCHIVRTMKATLTLLIIQPRVIMFRQHQDCCLNESDYCDPGNLSGQFCSKISKRTGIQVECRIRTGIPEEVILDEAAIGDYDLVAVSVQPRRGLGKFFSENLPYRVARNIPVSVLLLS